MDVLIFYLRRQAQPAKIDLIAERKRFVEKNVPVNQISTVNFASPVIRSALIFWKKSVWPDFGCPMSAMAVKALVSVRF